MNLLELPRLSELNPMIRGSHPNIHDLVRREKAKCKVKSLFAAFFKDTAPRPKKRVNITPLLKGWIMKQAYAYVIDKSRKWRP